MIPVIENITTIESVMDTIDQPMFLLDVHGENKFEFRRLNHCHRKVTGLDDNLTSGKRPHDVLPARLADTVVSNYEKCRASGAPYSYEENLELPAGTCWWQTSLSPIKDASGRVIKILGLAIDITDRKERFFEASQKLSEMTRLNEDLQVFAASTAHDMRGPFQTMIALLDMVLEGFVDLGDDKTDQLILCTEIASDAIRNMSGILEVAQGLQVPESAEELTDIHHIASDIAALLDPHQRISMDLPRLQLVTDRVALQMVLRNVMENAIRYADSKISVSVGPDPAEEGRIRITVSDDGVGRSAEIRGDGRSVLPKPSTTACDFGIQSARAMVESRGGELTLARCPFPTGASVRFSLPGRPAGKAVDMGKDLGSGATLPMVGFQRRNARLPDGMAGKATF